MQLKASAPGSLMLLGEYAVLHGKQALVCAIDKRISVTLTPRPDMKIEIQSSSLGNYSTELSTLKPEKPFQFILSALTQYQGKLKRGCNIHVETEFSDKVGLGSTAAVTVATLSALAALTDSKVSPLELIRQGRRVVRDIQGQGSGADIAASVFGGMVSYSAQPLSAEKLYVTHPLTALYSGYKTPTAQAIQHVQNYFSGFPNLFRQICNSIGQCAAEGLHYARKSDWMKLGEITNMQQGMLESLGVSSPLLRNMIDDLRAQDGILGAKISGSGMGDCIIGLGALPSSYANENVQQGVQQIPIAMTLQGVQCEKI